MKDDGEPEEHECDEAYWEEKNRSEAFFRKWALGFSRCLDEQQRMWFRESMMWVATTMNAHLLTRIVYQTGCSDSHGVVIDERSCDWLQTMLMQYAPEDTDWFPVFLEKWNAAVGQEYGSLPSKAMIDGVIFGIRHGLSGGPGETWVLSL